MKRIIWLLLVLLVVGLQATPQDATSRRDGNILLQECNQAIRAIDENIKALDDVQRVQAFTCFGYVEGFRDGHNLTTMLKGNRGHYCRQGRSVPHGQFLRIIVKWLKDNPDKLDLDKSVLVIAALREAFPCPAQE